MVACMAVGVPVRAADVPILGTKLLIKDTGRASKLVFRSKDQSIELPDPAEGPDRVGAVLTVLNPTTGTSGTLALGAAGWRVRRNGTLYKYNDGLVKVLLRNGRQLKIRVRNTVIGIKDPSQGTLAVLFEVGTLRYCALFDASSVRRDRPCKFVAKRAAAPLACPSAVASPSGAFLPGRGSHLLIPAGSPGPDALVRSGPLERPSFGAPVLPR